MRYVNYWFVCLLLIVWFDSTAYALMGPPPLPLPPVILDESHPSLPTFTPAEMWNIDKKVDDGMPGTGQTVIYGTDSSTSITNCTDGADASEASAATAKYLLNVDTKTCAAVFRNQF